MKQSATRAAAAAFLLLAGCMGRTGETLDPTATYDAYGETITPDEAIPVVAVAAERDAYVGKSVKIEGVVVEVCQTSGCWLTMDAGDGALLRVDVPRDSAGVYVYTFPKDIAGRRVILGGTLALGADAAREHGDHAGEESHEAMEAADTAGSAPTVDAAHVEAEARAMSVELALVARGALVERVRAAE